MTAVLAKTMLESAIAVADWVLSCQQIRNPSRYDEIFEKLYSSFSESREDVEIYHLFLTVLDDVFDILTDGQANGNVKAGTVALDGNAEHKIEVEKSYVELLKEAEDFFMFLFIFANTLKVPPNCPRTPPGFHTYNVIMILADVSQTNENQRPNFCDFRLKMMMNGFNIISQDSPLRHEACLEIVKFAAKYNLFEKLLPHLDDIKEWVKRDRHITPARSREIYSIIVSQFEKVKRLDQVVFSFLLLIVEEFDKEDNLEIVQSATDAAVALVSAAIKIPDIMAFNQLIQSSSVQKLGSGPHAPLLNLVDIFYDGDHHDFLRFHENHPDVFTTYGFDYNTCYNKIQLLVLASLATSCTPSSPRSQSKATWLPLKKVADRLELSLDEAEKLAIAAISCGLIDGKIDQMNSEIAVRSAFQRVFGRLQWVQLAQQLIQLNESVEKMLSHLEKCDGNGVA